MSFRKILAVPVNKSYEQLKAMRLMIMNNAIMDEDDYYCGDSAGGVNADVISASHYYKSEVQVLRWAAKKTRHCNVDTPVVDVCQLGYWSQDKGKWCVAQARFLLFSWTPIQNPMLKGTAT